MKIVVLLSNGRHPISARPSLPRNEAQAIGLALTLGQASGLHAGGNDEAMTAALGHGLSAVDRIGLDEDSDCLSPLHAFLAEVKPDLILAGRRGEGGLDSGLLPYRLAQALAMPVLADAVSLAEGEQAGTLRIDQAMEKGARRRVVIRLPALVSVHPLAPPPPPFVYGASRRGTIRNHAADAPAAAPLSSPLSWPLVEGFEERAYRSRPKLIAQGSAGSNSQNLHVDPAPEEAARMILDHLGALGIRSY